MNAFISALPGVFDAIEASDEVREAFVFAAWRHVAGEQIADRTSPVSVKDRNLMIAVADKTWKRNLESLASQLLFRINTFLGRDTVTYIEFSIAPDRIKLGVEMADAPVEAGAELPEGLSTSLSKIRDDELREKVSTAAKACLSRKQTFSYLDSENIN